MRRILLSLLVALLVPMSAGALPPPVYAADDAGSGADAPRDLARAVPIEPGIMYRGAFQGIWLAPNEVFWDDGDSYSFQAEEGDVVEARVSGPQTISRVRDGDGADLTFDYSTAHFGWTAGIATIPATGTYYLTITTFSIPQEYCFSIGMNARAPVSPTGLPCPMDIAAPWPAPLVQNDAGTGTDAPGSLDPRIMLGPDVHYQGRLHGAWPDEFLVDLDVQDTYAFEAREGDAIVVWVLAPQILYGLYAPDGTLLESDITTGYVRMLGMQATAPESGTYFLKFQGAPQAYCFAYDLNDRTPPASWLMLPGCTV